MTRQNVETNLASIDRALEWLVLLLTVLVGVIFQFLTWATKPESLVGLTAKFMISLTMPLVLLIISLMWQLMTLSEERKISLRLFSWSLLSMIFSFDLMMLVALAAMALTKEFPIVALTSIAIGSIAVGLFPYRRIMTVYRRSTRENDYWQRSNAHRWAPFLLGASLSGVLILLPFILP